MNRARALAALLVCVAMDASGALHAQARGPAANQAQSSEKQVEKPALVLDEAARARKLAEMQAWLGRLVGRFSVDGEWIWRDSFAQRDITDKVNGTALCSGIGDGPGVRCLIQAIRPQRAMPAELAPLPGDQPNLHLLPILYFGINPDTLEIHVMWVDVKQAGARSGMLAGDTVGFSVDNWKICHNVYTHCWIVAEVTAEPAGEIFMKVAADYFVNVRKAAVTKSGGHWADMELHLHRELPVDATVPGNAP